MKVAVVADTVEKIRTDPRVRAKAITGSFVSLGIVGLTDEEQRALQAFAQRIEAGQGLPAHLTREDSSSLVWI